jgi:hypothetical protein
VIAGNFTGTRGRCISRWNGTQLVPLGSGLSAFTYATARLPNGNIVAGGDFTTAGGVSSPRIAQWNGTSWQTIGPANQGSSVNSLLVLPNGDLVAGGGFSRFGTIDTRGIARWDGTTWTGFGAGLNTGIFENVVFALTTDSSGAIIAGGGFSSSGFTSVGSLVRWNGTTWNPLGAFATGVVRSLLTLPNGDIIAGGRDLTFGPDTFGGIARWNGSQWLPVGTGISGTVLSLARDTDGSIIAGGTFDSAGGVPASRIARWDGTQWLPVGAGVTGSTSNTEIGSLAIAANGDLLAGGFFSGIGGQAINTLARWNFVQPIQITQHPQPNTACRSSNADFSITHTGDGILSYQWQIETAPDQWANLSNLAISLPCGGTATGPAVRLTSIRVNPCPGVDQYRVRCVVTNECGPVASNPATLTICRADFNCDRVVDFFDYLDFVAAFAANQPAADFNADTVIDFFDYLDFVESFAAGC